MLPHIDAIMSFLELLVSEQRNDYDNKVLSKVVGLIGDISSTLGQQIMRQINKLLIFTLLQEGSKYSGPTIQSTSSWVMGLLLLKA